MLIKSSEELRELTGSFYANADFTRISHIVETVQREVARIIGQATMTWLEGDGKDSDAADACRTAIAYMATLRYYRLNDISHEDMGRKVKIDHENEARPFEWQLARDDRMHLEEYYRALDRLISCLSDNEHFIGTDACKRIGTLIIKDADSLTWLTGIDPSPWLFMRMVPYISESQRFVEKAYGQSFNPEDFHPFPDTDTMEYAAQKAVALGAIALMGRRTSLQALPYGLMKIFESDGGGNRQEAAALDRLDDYLKHLSKDQHYWLNEMKTLRDEEAGLEPVPHLQMPENDQKNKFMRV